LRELFRMSHQEIRLRIGKPLPFEKLALLRDEVKITDYLRLRTYLLGKHRDCARRRAVARVRKFIRPRVSQRIAGYREPASLPHSLRPGEHQQSISLDIAGADRGLFQKPPKVRAHAICHGQYTAGEEPAQTVRAQSDLPSCRESAGSAGNRFLHRKQTAKASPSC